MKRFSLFLTLVAVAMIGTSTYADVPKLINYQGRLTDLSGSPFADATYPITFRIWDTPAGGSPLWSEMHSVVTNDGLFSVQLGTFVTLPDNIFDGTERYVGVTVDTDPEMPRQRLVSTPYSYRVRTVDGATGGIISGNTSIQSDLTVSGNMGIGTSTPEEKLQLSNGRLMMGNFAYQKNSNHPGDMLFENGLADKPGIKFYHADNKNFGIDVFNDGTSYLRFVEDLDEGTGQSRMVIREGGNVGIGTINPTTNLDIVGDLKVSGNIIGSTPWTPFPFAAGYNNYEDAHPEHPAVVQTVQYRKIGDIVYLRGLAHKSDHAVIPSGAVLGTLPIGFRPPGMLGFSTAPGVSYIEIYPSGDVVSFFSSPEHQHLDGASFSTIP